MATLFVLLTVSAVSSTFAYNVYYVTSENSGLKYLCRPDEICHNLSYYISVAVDDLTLDCTTVSHLVLPLEGDLVLRQSQKLCTLANVHSF